MKKLQNTALRMVRSNGFPRVEIVEDAKEAIEVEVTKRDENTGIPNDPNKCAMAKACCRNMGATGAIIGRGVSYIIFGNKARRYKNTETLTREVVTYDRAKIFFAGLYRLSPFPPTSRLGYHSSKVRSANGKRRNNHGRWKPHITANVRILNRSLPPGPEKKTKK